MSDLQVDNLTDFFISIDVIVFSKIRDPRWDFATHDSVMTQYFKLSLLWNREKAVISGEQLNK